MQKRNRGNQTAIGSNGRSSLRNAMWLVVGIVLCTALLCVGTVNASAGETADSSASKSASQVADSQTDAQPTDTYITDWSWDDKDGVLVESDGTWYLALSAEDAKNVDEDDVEALLPKKMNVTLANGEKTSVPILWNGVFSEKVESPLGDGGDAYQVKASIDGYTLAEDVPAPAVTILFGGAEAYAATYPGTREPLTNADDSFWAGHQVHGITPAGTTVNLFDYDFGITGDDDVLPNGAKFEDYSNGINKDALLLFGGSAMREAGFWNQGSGAGRPWGKANVNMKGIVKSTLSEGYPYINLDDARSELENATHTPTDNWGTGELMDVANLNHAESENAGVDAARALSKKLLESRGLTVADDGNVSGTCEKASLGYLFDPDATTAGKTTHENVSGLFQIDGDGYYYYDARKNFAEYSASTNSFNLYDGPAVWRTDAGWNEETQTFDGDMSMGNFFPFDSAKKVFDSVQIADKSGKETNILSSSEDITNVHNKAHTNHYMGMTMQVDFTQPENGKLNMGSNGKQPMVFQFSGDDDVWVFIDDVLVLDLGGVHSELYGTIDFSTGEVITGQSWRTGGLPDNPGSVEHDEKTTLYNMFVAALGKDKADAMHWVEDNGKRSSPPAPSTA